MNFDTLTPSSCNYIKWADMDFFRVRKLAPPEDKIPEIWENEAPFPIWIIPTHQRGAWVGIIVEAVKQWMAEHTPPPECKGQWPFLPIEHHLPYWLDTLDIPWNSNIPLIIWDVEKERRLVNQIIVWDRARHKPSERKANPTLFELHPDCSYCQSGSYHNNAVHEQAIARANETYTDL